MAWNRLHVERKHFFAKNRKQIKTLSSINSVLSSKRHYKYRKMIGKLDISKKEVQFECPPKDSLASKIKNIFWKILKMKRNQMPLSFSNESS